MGISLGVYPEVRDETRLSLLLKIRAKFLLEEEEKRENILCCIWTFTGTFLKLTSVSKLHKCFLSPWFTTIMSKSTIIFVL